MSADTGIWTCADWECFSAVIMDISGLIHGVFVEMGIFEFSLIFSKDVLLVPHKSQISGHEIHKKNEIVRLI
jgi:hypothetical protein